MSKRAMTAAIVSAALAGLAVPAAAFEIDYPAIFETFAGEVREVSGTERVLDLPGPVKLIARRQENGATEYSPLDLSGLGPAGCGFEALVNAIAFGRHCTGVLSEDEMATLAALAERAAGFVSANVLVGASADPDAVLAEALAGASPLPCPGADNTGAGYVEQVRSFAAPAGVAALERMLSQPRLPVCAARIVASGD